MILDVGTIGGIPRDHGGISITPQKYSGPFEQVSRPFAVNDVLQRALDARPPQDNSETAELRWGAQPQFDIVDPTQVTQPSVTVTFPDDPNNPDNNGVPDSAVLVATEIWRDTKTVRVENPNDSSQYVDVEDAVKSLLSIQVSGGPIYLRIDWKQA